MHELRDLLGKTGWERIILIGNNGSGPSIGKLHQDGVLESFRSSRNGKSYIMKELYRVSSSLKPFIEPGDSGSGVFVEHEGKLHCIGIALANDCSGLSGYVTPIDSVLKALGSSFKLKIF